MGSEAIVERRSVQSITMGDFDSVDAGIIQGFGYHRDLVSRVFVADGVHSVPQRHVLDVKPICIGIEHLGYATSFVNWRIAIFSPVLRAAEVMMSRLPA